MEVDLNMRATALGLAQIEIDEVESELNETTSALVAAASTLANASSSIHRFLDRKGRPVNTESAVSEMALLPTADSVTGMIREIADKREQLAALLPRIARLRSVR